jgi:hypothetical protein
MTEHTAYVLFLVVACGGLAAVTMGMLAAAVVLWRRNRERPRR